MNNNPTITKRVPTHEDVEFLENRLGEHNSLQIWQDDGELFTFLIRNEQQARAHGFQVLMLSSYRFQALEFYQKCGFELAWQLDDFPPGHPYCFLVTRLADPEMG